MAGFSCKVHRHIFGKHLDWSVSPIDEQRFVNILGSVVAMYILLAVLDVRTDQFNFLRSSISLAVKTEPYSV